MSKMSFVIDWLDTRSSRSTPQSFYTTSFMVRRGLCHKKDKVKEEKASKHVMSARRADQCPLYTSCANKKCNSCSTPHSGLSDTRSCGVTLATAISLPHNRCEEDAFFSTNSPHESGSVEQQSVSDVVSWGLQETRLTKLTKNVRCTARCDELRHPLRAVIPLVQSQHNKQNKEVTGSQPLKQH